MIAVHAILLCASLYAAVLWFRVARQARKAELFKEASVLGNFIIVACLFVSIQVYYFYTVGMKLQYLSWEMFTNIQQYLDNTLDVLNSAAAMAALLAGAGVRRYTQRKIEEDGQHSTAT